MKKVLSVILIIAILMTMGVLSAVSASAATTDSGTCGENAAWSLKNGVLTITGTGEIDDFDVDSSNISSAPWHRYRTEISKVVIGEGITKIGIYSFYNLDWMTTAELPSTLTVIDKGAFQRSDNLMTVNMPDALKAIKARAFADCIRLDNIVFSANSQLETIGEFAFNSCNDLDEMYLPDSVNFVAVGAFAYCEYLKSFRFSPSMTIIQRQTLNNCRRLVNVDVPSSITRIKEYAFCNCQALTAIDIPDVKNIESYAFYCCSALAKVNLNDSVKLESGAFNSCNSLNPQIAITKNLWSKYTVPNVGDTATLTIEATGEGLKYDWYYRNKGESAYTKSSNHASTYDVQVTGARLGRQVYCVVTDRYMRTKKSTVCTLSFNNPKLKITQQPQSVTVAKAGDTATVSIGVEGEGLKYTWYYCNKGSNNWTESSIHKAVVNVAVTEARYGRQMYCVIKDKYNRTVTSKTITLTFDTGLRITQSPVDTEVENEGDTAKLKIVAEGKGKTYTWYYRNAGATKWVKSSVTSSSYSTAMSAARDGRQVYCIVKDKYGVTVATDPVTLTIKK